MNLPGESISYCGRTKMWSPVCGMWTTAPLRRSWNLFYEHLKAGLDRNRVNAKIPSHQLDFIKNYRDKAKPNLLGWLRGNWRWHKTIHFREI